VGQSLWPILYWAWVITEVLLVVVTRTRKGDGGVHDRGSILVLWVVIFSSIWCASWYGATHVHTLFGGASWVRTSAVALMAAGLAVRWASIWSLGRAFSVNVAIHADQKLYRGGLFGLVRHPSYTGMMIIFAAIGVRLENWGALALVVLGPLAALLYRIHVEEAALGRAFGADYQDYSRTTKRLIPGIY
jgi:protein-S-isoprenylcysteine O-methyltransferase Ste14